MTALRLVEVPGDYSVLRFPPEAQPPAWAFQGAFSSVSKSSDELSIVCESRLVPSPSTARVEGEWRCLRVEGTLDFALTGILSRIAAPLAAAEISIFAISTFDTDYVMVKARDLDAAKSALSAAGFVTR